MSDKQTSLDVNSVDKYLAELSKELKKEYGKRASFELIVVGGASIVMNYDFRSLTTDIDHVVSGGSIKDAVHRVADKFGISDGWLNSDFRTTASYSPKLIQYSKPYKCFNQILNVRTVQAEYLLAMKLVSFRSYKRDRSDIIGILDSHNKRGEPISLEKVDVAVKNLYGGWDIVSDEAKEFITKALTMDYDEEIKYENQNNEIVKNIKQISNLKSEDVDEVVKMIREKKGLEERFEEAKREAAATKGLTKKQKDIATLER